MSNFVKKKASGGRSTGISDALHGVFHKKKDKVMDNNSPSPAATKSQAPTKTRVLISYNSNDTSSTKNFVKEKLHPTMAEKLAQTHEVVISVDEQNGDSMANVVASAQLVVVIETKGYEANNSCKRELQFAASRAVPVFPVRLLSDEKEQWKPTNWLALLISPSVRRFTFKPSETLQDQEVFDELCSKIREAKPVNVKSGSKIYISYTTEDKDYASVFKTAFETLENSNQQKQKRNKNSAPVFECLIKEDIDKELEKQQETRDSNMSNEQRRREVVEQLIFSPEVVAVVLILTPKYVEDEYCLHEARFAHNTQTLLIPTLWQQLEKFPPPALESCLESLYIDFSHISHRDVDKVNFRVSAVRRAAKKAETINPFANYTDVNFIVKRVGEWSEEDVCNWLRYINLSEYVNKFKNNLVNGRVLLNLTEKDLTSDYKMKLLHQRVFFSSVDALYEAITWDNNKVLQWLLSNGLQVVHDKLQVDKSINGKALLVLSDADLINYGVEFASSRKRLLDEIHLLKLRKAKVRIEERYRYHLLTDIIVPVASDQYNKFRFHPDIPGMFLDIIERVKDSPVGLLQSGLRKFLFVILLIAYTYKKEYGTKTFWFDANRVEMAAIRHAYLKRFLRRKPAGARASGEWNEKKIERLKFLDFDDMYSLMGAITAELLEEDTEDTEPKVLIGPMKPPLLAQIKLQYGENKAKFINSLWLQYIMLENLTGKLFSLFDRTVNGCLSIGELLAGMDVLIFGSMTEKVKVGFSLADLNDDGYLAPEEVVQFYEDQFLTVLRAIKKSELVNNFPSKCEVHSVLSYIYELIAEKMDEDAPKYLNPKLNIDYFGASGTEYDSEQQDQALEVLSMGGRVYRTPAKRNVDFIFKSREAMTITNLYIGGNTTSNSESEGYVKNALIWFSDKRIENWDWGKYDRLPGPNDKILPEPAAVISTTLPSVETTIRFPEPKCNVKFIYVKLLDTHGRGNVNLTLEFFGIWGFVGPTPRGYKVPELDNTKEMFVRSGGIASPVEVQTVLTRVSMVQAVKGFYTAATEYADSHRIPEPPSSSSGQQAENSLGITKEIMDALTNSMNYVQPEYGNADVNQVRILQDILPLTHVFLLFRGDDPMTVLTGPL